MRTKRHWLAVCVATAAGVLLLAARSDFGQRLLRAAAQAPQSVDDRAPLLAAGERARIDEYHAVLRATHDIDYRVLAVDSGADLERTAHDYFADARVGSLSENGRGLLLVIDSGSQRVRLEVSTSLEGVYTDAFVAYVQNRQMAPFFAAGRVADGVLATTELIVGRANEARAGAEFAPPMAAESMGGGASARAPIGSASRPSEDLEQQTERIDATGLDPLQVVEVYHDRMAKRDARADLALYSSDTMAMLRGWVVTPAQMDNVARTYRDCTVDGVRAEGDVAVVRYRVEQRQCAPYFLRREDAIWKLDLTQMSSAIRFNHENQWRFQTPLARDYAFAFSDWRIDRNGFPHAR
jgi:uncharacterized protein